MAISGPIALYSNVPIHPEYYKPRSYQISNITLGQTTIITTVKNQDYVIGQQIRVLVPNGYGCQQINEMTAFVLSLPSLNQVEISLDSTKFDPFLMLSLRQIPQIVAIGDVNTGHTNLDNKHTKPWIPGSFRNISPK
jgi:hypothetical protein